MRLLLVEDNAELARLTARGLSQAGFEADVAASLADASDLLGANAYGAIILDLGLPDGDGLSLLATLRARSDETPVLVLTARGTLQDRVTGLHKGADDYLIKPFALEELVARLHALLRRPPHYLGRSRRAGNIVFDPVGRQLQIDGRPQFLSAREMALLELLIARLGRVVPKDFVEGQLFGTSEDIRSNAIEVYVHRLRRQLADFGATVEIQTVRGVGYLMQETNA